MSLILIFCHNNNSISYYLQQEHEQTRPSQAFLSNKSGKSKRELDERKAWGNLACEDRIRKDLSVTLELDEVTCNLQ